MRNVLALSLTLAILAPLSLADTLGRKASRAWDAGWKEIGELVSFTTDFGPFKEFVRVSDDFVEWKWFSDVQCNQMPSAKELSELERERRALKAYNDTGTCPIDYESTLPHSGMSKFGMRFEEYKKAKKDIDEPWGWIKEVAAATIPKLEATGLHYGSMKHAIERDLIGKPGMEAATAEVRQLRGVLLALNQITIDKNFIATDGHRPVRPHDIPCNIYTNVACRKKHDDKIARLRQLNAARDQLIKNNPILAHNAFSYWIADKNFQKEMKKRDFEKDFKAALVEAYGDSQLMVDKKEAQYQALLKTEATAGEQLDKIEDAVDDRKLIAELLVAAKSDKELDSRLNHSVTCRMETKAASHLAGSELRGFALNSALLLSGAWGMSAARASKLLPAERMLGAVVAGGAEAAFVVADLKHMSDLDKECHGLWAVAHASKSSKAQGDALTCQNQLENAKSMALISLAFAGYGLRDVQKAYQEGLMSGTAAAKRATGASDNIAVKSAADSLEALQAKYPNLFKLFPGEEAALADYIRLLEKEGRLNADQVAKQVKVAREKLALSCKR